MLSLLYDYFWWIVGGATVIIVYVILIWLWKRQYQSFYRSRTRYSKYYEMSDMMHKDNINASRDIIIGEQVSSYNSTKIIIDKDQDVVHSKGKPEWYEILQEELKRLPIGKIVFNPPDVMKLGVKDRIEARITKNIQENLLESLKGRGIPKSEQLKISELVKVRLSGNDFNIIKLNEEEQIIENTGFTEWAWDVTPKKSGKKTLHLHVTLRIRLPFGEERKDHPVLDREIVVKVNPTYSVKIFFVSYWKWVVTALILPLIGLAWKLYTK